jgi:decaprenyl-phosphate phosphoribosyltransferase
LAAPLCWLVAVVQSTRPRQWPKNLLVFAAPLAGVTFGRPYGFWYAMAALGTFIAASSAVYLVNDVVDAERDRGHPYKRFRPVASGRLPAAHAAVLAVMLVIAAVGASLIIGEPLLSAVVAAYLAISFLYSGWLKHVSVIELVCVASGFVLRVVGGAAATRVPPSGYFLLVCSLGALMVAIAKRYAELIVLGSGAAKHRPAMRGYSAPALRLTQRAVSTVMIVSYVLWAWSEPQPKTRSWDLISSIALAGALARFDRLTARATSRPVEDLIARDPLMVLCEAAWLILFAVGL